MVPISRAFQRPGGGLSRSPDGSTTEQVSGDLLDPAADGIPVPEVVDRGPPGGDHGPLADVETRRVQAPRKYCMRPRTGHLGDRRPSVYLFGREGRLADRPAPTPRAPTTTSCASADAARRAPTASPRSTVRSVRSAGSRSSTDAATPSNRGSTLVCGSAGGARSSGLMAPIPTSGRPSNGHCSACRRWRRSARRASWPPSRRSRRRPAGGPVHRSSGAPRCQAGAPAAGRVAPGVQARVRRDAAAEQVGELPASSLRADSAAGQGLRDQHGGTSGPLTGSGAACSVEAQATAGARRPGGPEEQP